MIARKISAHPVGLRRCIRSRVLLALVAGLIAFVSLPDVRSAQAQILAFPGRPAPIKGPDRSGDPQMLVRADRLDYDYTNHRVSAVGNVQIYHQGATIEADKVIYDQKNKRMHGEGNVRLTEPDGKITYGEILDFGEDFRDGFVDSLRVETPEQTRIAATRADRTGGNFTVFQSGVYTACEPCKDDPKKPPLWQVKAARIVHDQGEKMIYFENARLEFFGMPLAYMPYFSTPDPTVKRKTGVLMPSFSSSSKYGTSVEVPYFWALAPDRDLTLSPMVTSRQGVLMKSEWRQRLMTGSYSIRAAGIFQRDKDFFLRTDGGPPTPGYADARGSLETSGQFALTDKWSWGWNGMLLSDRTFFQDYGLLTYALNTDLIFRVQTEAVSQLYFVGRGDRSYFDARALHYYGFSEADVQGQIPTVHPVIDHKYTFEDPVLGGELGFNSNLTSLSRAQADFNPVSASALLTGACTPTANPALKTPTNCLLRGVPGTYTRFSSELHWRRTVIDSYGQVFTPFAMLRGDAAAMRITPEFGVPNYLTPGDSTAARVMPTVGLEYRYPFVGVQSWGTQTIEPIAQVIIRPNETGTGNFPNEDAQSFVFDDSNLFRVDKYSGWDRAEGGGRANVGLQYRAQFNRAGSLNFLVGQSYQLFGQNSYEVGGVSNTGVGSGLDKTRSDYVAGVGYQPNSRLAFSSRFRFNERDYTMRRFEFETSANFGRWNTSLLYGNYDAEPALGYLTRRQGLLGVGTLKLTANWAVSGGLRYDLEASRVNQTQIGVGYIDDCLILALNYITDYSYSGNSTTDQRVMLQIGFRTLGDASVSQNLSGTGSLP